jgi:thioredoxin reductase (NADPH)
VLVRRDVMRASQAMQERVKKDKKIEILWNTEAQEVLGEASVSGLKIINNKTKKSSKLDIGGLFFAIGHTPNTQFLDGQLKLDETGYINTTPGTTKTNVEGVFAAGDVQDKVYRQAVTAAGTGCMAALEAEKFLSEHTS